ncbi:MAG: zinc-binding alcohol dehydrogenase family protein [Lactobacillus sp.]|jgi:NADPH:quinone reductase-like Zn-dependent oxidoreductase|nr:zinc-binding alcohol dehydrogenase family protein [Lactobacillus sp.]MCH3906306.1 zinc-binding alcohol dehydrogenase family protein [Lactobacillus sp.]MCH3990119.1 zinc-binding alcohol dehydrogenase family protein [Lactobacillus sp.]MCH4069167.1 zinc-binding alcohol dehydrogenase family protein [Lactobacillus sp.]MCI1303469.1 zinc-binding alcohol dehydrogenase family protein [Lactobacillus sp.]
MKAIVIHQAGGPEQLKLENVPVPKIKKDWSLVKIKGLGINHSEIFTRKGLSPTVKFPRILGIECVGVIEETTDPEHLPVGQKIVSIMGEMGRDFDGSYAEYVLLPNKQIYPVDTDLDWTTLAALPETYYTAFGSFLNLKINEHDKILVRGGTSGVGIAFLKLVKAKYPNIFIAGTSRSLVKERIMKDAGYDQVIIDQDGELQTKQKFNKILELIGPKTVKNSFKHTSEGGIVCSTGELGNQWYLNNFDPIMDIVPNAYLTSFYSNNVDQDRLNEMLKFVKKYKVDAKPEKVFDLEHVADAHRYLESRHSFGKVVVVED